MTDRLKEHLDSVFSNAPDTEKNRELKEEIYSNLSDKYNAFIAEGKSEEEAYRLSISTLGDIYSVIGFTPRENNTEAAVQVSASDGKKDEGYRPTVEERRLMHEWSRRCALMRAIAVALYISSFVFFMIPSLFSAGVINGMVSGLISICPAAMVITCATALIIVSVNTPPARVKELNRMKITVEEADLTEEELAIKAERRKLYSNLRVTAIILYVFCAMPLVICVVAGLPAVIGTILLFLAIAAATGLLVYSKNFNNLFASMPSRRDDAADAADGKGGKRQRPSASPACNTTKTLVFFAMLAIYLVLSFNTHAWAVTWIIFPIDVALSLLIDGIFDLNGGDGQ